MPPSTDQVQSSTNQYRLILTQFLQVLTSSALYWPSATKYQPAFERISTCISFLNLTTYKFISGVEFDQGYLSFFIFIQAFQTLPSFSRCFLSSLIFYFSPNLCLSSLQFLFKFFPHFPGGLRVLSFPISSIHPFNSKFYPSIPFHALPSFYTLSCHTLSPFLIFQALFLTSLVFILIPASFFPFPCLILNPESLSFLVLFPHSFFNFFPQVVLSFTICPFHNFSVILIVVLKGSSVSCDSDVSHHAMSCLNILKDFASPLEIIYA